MKLANNRVGSSVHQDVIMSSYVDCCHTYGDHSIARYVMKLLTRFSNMRPLLIIVDSVEVNIETILSHASPHMPQ